MWLQISTKQKETYLKQGFFYAKRDWTDWRWLSYHKSITVVLEGNLRKVIIDMSYQPKLIYHPVLKKDMIYIEDKCIKLLSNNKCAIYRIRPKACKIGECPVFTTNKVWAWMGRHGTLKKQRLEYEKRN